MNTVLWKEYADNVIARDGDNALSQKYLKWLKSYFLYDVVKLSDGKMILIENAHINNYFIVNDKYSDKVCKNLFTEDESQKVFYAENMKNLNANIDKLKSKDFTPYLSKAPYQAFNLEFIKSENVNKVSHPERLIFNEIDKSTLLKTLEMQREKFENKLTKYISKHKIAPLLSCKQ